MAIVTMKGDSFNTALIFFGLTRFLKGPTAIQTIGIVIGVVAVLVGVVLYGLGMSYGGDVTTPGVVVIVVGIILVIGSIALLLLPKRLRPASIKDTTLYS